MRLESVHYKALRIGYYDFKNNMSRNVLDHDRLLLRNGPTKAYRVSSSGFTHLDVLGSFTIDLTVKGT